DAESSSDDSEQPARASARAPPTRTDTGRRNGRAGMGSAMFFQSRVNVNIHSEYAHVVTADVFEPTNRSTPTQPESSGHKPQEGRRDAARTAATPRRIHNPGLTSIKLNHAEIFDRAGNRL